MSSKKRELQKKKREKAIRRAQMKKSARNIAIGAAIVLVLGLIGYFIYYKTVLITAPIENYSEGLNEDGTIEGVVVQDYVKLGQYQDMKVDYSELGVDESIIESQIETVLNNNKEYSTEAGAVVQLYDEINLDYVGTIDGVAFEGGSTADGGTVITVGEAGYIDDFEEQLVGHKIGEEFDIEVTFPEEYGNAELAGKDAVFSIRLNGIYSKPEFDDAFVKEHLSDVALTAEAYRAYLLEEAEKEALEQYVQNYLTEYCLVQEYPEEYVEDVMGLTKFADQQEYDYMNQLFGGAYGTLAEYKGAANELEYEAALRLRAQEIVAGHMSVQAIYEDAGLSVTSEHMDAVMEELGATADFKLQMEEMYGKGYINQLAMKQAVVDYLMDNAEIVK